MYHNMFLLRNKKKMPLTRALVMMNCIICFLVFQGCREKEKGEGHLSHASQSGRRLQENETRTCYVIHVAVCVICIIHCK